jgi:multiple sugar transport system permease protein
MKTELKKKLVPYTFIAPNFIGFFIFSLIPIIFSLILAFMKWDGSHHVEFIGLKNFIKLASDTQFHAAFKNTIVFAIGTIPLTLVLSIFLAVVLNQKIKGANEFRSVFFFPYIASIVAVAAVWNMLFNPTRGPVNSMLYALGATSVPGWAADKDWAMITLIMFCVWKNAGYYMIIYLAGLQGIPNDLYEAAKMDGAGSWQKFRYITLPELSNTTFFVLMMLTIFTFKIYTEVYMITQGGPGTATLVMVYDIYNKAFINWKLGLASAEAMILFLMVLIITLVQYYGGKRRDT